ncbi:unnamed protein product [Scytosiphon promiscuus]
MVETAAMATRVQANLLFGQVQLPATDNLWAEAMHWACDSLNQTACSSNPDSKSPYEMWFGEARPARPYPFLKPANCRWQRPSNLCRKVKAVFTLILREITRVTAIECLRGLVKFRKQEMLRGRRRRHASLHRSPSCLWRRRRREAREGG